MRAHGYAAALARFVGDRLAPKCVMVVGAEARSIADHFAARGVAAVAASWPAATLAVEKAIFADRSFDLVLLRPGRDDRGMLRKLLARVGELTKLVLLDVSGLDALSDEEARRILTDAAAHGLAPRRDPDLCALPLCLLAAQPGEARAADEAAKALARAVCLSAGCAADPDLLFAGAAPERLRIVAGAAFAPDLSQRAERAARRDPVSYAQWCRLHEPDAEALARQRRAVPTFAVRPPFVLTCSIGNTPAWMVREMIHSVEAQTYPHWLLWLIHDKPEEQQTRDLVLEMAVVEPRIRASILKETRAGAAEDEIDVEHDAYVARLRATDLLAPFALFDVAELLNRRPDLRVVHADVDGLGVDGERRSPCLGGTGVFGPWVPLTQERQFVVALRGAAAAEPVACAPAHIARVHCHARDLAPRNPASLHPSPGPGASTFQTPFGGVRVAWRDRVVATSIIVVAAAATKDVLAAVTQLLRLMSLHDTEILLPASSWGGRAPEPVVGVVTPPDAALLERVQAAVERSRGEVLVFLDIAARPALPDWQKELRGPLCDPQIAIVGARSIDPISRRVEHAGLVFDIDGRLEALQEADGTLGPSAATRSYAYRTAIGGAAFSIRRSDFDRAGGFRDTVGFPRADVDLCLRVRETTGKRVLYNPYLAFWRYGPALLEDWLDDPDVSAAWLRRHFPAGDPCTSPNLVVSDGGLYLRGPCSPAGTDPERW